MARARARAGVDKARGAGGGEAHGAAAGEVWARATREGVAGGEAGRRGGMSERAGAGSSERRPWEGVWEVAKDGELRTKKRTPPPARLESVGGDTSKSMAALVGAAACAAAGWVLAHAGGRSPRRVKRNNTLEMPVIAPFEGSTVLVTGCSRGMGPGWCKALLARGTNVIAGCRNPRTAAVVNELAAKGGKGGAWCKVVQLDLGWSENRLAKFAEDLRTKHGVRRVDLLVNNAGLGEADDPLLKASKDNLMSFFEVNTVGPILLTQVRCEHMRAFGLGVVAHARAGAHAPSPPNPSPRARAPAQADRLCCARARAGAAAAHECRGRPQDGVQPQLGPW